MKRLLFTLMILILTLLTGMASAQDSASPQPSDKGTVHSITLPDIRVELKDGPGRVKTETFCNICHSVGYILMQPKANRAQWTASVNKMIKTFGAPIQPEDAETIITYITENYGTGK
jgi:cytochrome c5